MSKVICEICGTVYPDNATVCPICGYPRSVDEELELLEEEVPQAPARRSEPVKGGRFSNKNVKKRKQEADTREVEPAEKSERKAASSGKKKSGKRKKHKKSNRGLVITAIVLFVAVLLVGAYIGMRFFVGKDAYRETTIPTGTVEVPTQATETEPVDTSVACTDILIEGIKMESGAEFTGVGRSIRLNISAVPENTTDTFTYTSSDESVAMVNVTEGRVEILSVGPGSTTITVTCGAVSKSFPVLCSFEMETVEATEQTGEDNREEGVLALDADDISFFDVDENRTLNPGKGIDPKDVKWSSDDEEVATVDENGKVVAVGIGTCEVTAEYEGEKAVCVVRCNFKSDEEADETTEATEETKKVEDAGGPYKISHSDVTLYVGEKFELKLRDKNGDVVDVTWTGDDHVEIDGNTITAARRTNSYTTVKCTHNGEEFKCKVRVG